MKPRSRAIWTQRGPVCLTARMNTPWKITDNGLLITLRLTPKGGRDALEGVVMDTDGRPALKARVSAPPVDGAANKALVKLLAKSLGVPKSRVIFTSGETARVKRILVEGDSAQMIEKIQKLIS